MIRCTDMINQSSKLIPEKFFCPEPMEVNARGSSDQIFQTAVISEYVSEFGLDRSVTSEIRHQKRRKKKEINKKPQRKI